MNPDVSALIINVVVHAPREADPKRFRWPVTTRVGDAAKEAAAAFKYDPKGTPPTFQNQKGRVLDINKTLLEEKVQDGDVLDLVSSGGGVS